jgi:beta-1,4-mannosyl-glycoprotein beta-1,4-N-acetylglucosaminyltransferase
MLEFRLTELYDYVDYFVIVEADRTFSGTPKKSFFQENISLFEKFKDKIKIGNAIVPEKFKSNFDIEIIQRNYIRNVLDELTPADEDLVIISDIDEIPDRNNLKVGTLNQDLYYYNLETKLDILWTAAAIIEYKYLKGYESIQKFRVGNNLTPIKSGWHFSFFGDEEFIANKIRNYSHQEYNNEKHTDLDFIKKCISEKSDLFLRGVNINSIPIKENDYLPINYKMLL